MGREVVVFYHRLTDHLYSSTGYNKTLDWICCTLSFSLLCSATMCIRAGWSILHRSSDASPEMGQYKDFYVNVCLFMFNVADYKKISGVVCDSKYKSANIYCLFAEMMIEI